MQTEDFLRLSREALAVADAYLPNGGGYRTCDSGSRETFPETGAQRDTRTGKGRYDLLPADAIHRVAQLYERGAAKYEDRNWEKGMPLSRMADSMLRHAFQAVSGDRGEDHWAAVVFNALGVMAYQERIARGELPPALDDLPGGAG